MSSEARRNILKPAYCLSPPPWIVVRNVPARENDRCISNNKRIVQKVQSFRLHLGKTKSTLVGPYGGGAPQLWVNSNFARFFLSPSFHCFVVKPHVRKHFWRYCIIVIEHQIFVTLYTSCSSLCIRIISLS